MPMLSTLRAPALAGVRLALASSSKDVLNRVNFTQVRNMGGARKMQVTPSKFQWHRMKDDVHYFITIGLIPVGLFIAYMNIRIGPAELKDIPEGYVPQSHEYIRGPVQRVLMQIINYNSYEMAYERSLYFLNKAHLNQQATLNRFKVNQLSKERQDTHGWYLVPQSTERREQARYSAMERDRASPKV